MTPAHDEILSAIERKVATAGARPGEVDERVACELGVPAGDYYAYVVVAGAIEAYAEQTHGQQTLLADREPSRGPLERAWSLTQAISVSAHAICHDTAGEGHREVHRAASHIVATAMQLRANLRQLDAKRAKAAGRTRLTLAPRRREVAADGR